MKQFTIGSDPEAFIVNDRTGNVVSAKRFTDGTKHEPEDCGNGYAILNDNVLIEGNVPPAKSEREFVGNMTELWNIMNSRAQTRNAHLHNADYMQITDALAETPEAKEFGCSSFRDAWNELVEIQTPQLPGRKRPAGCHIHLGFEGINPAAVVRAFDMMVVWPRVMSTGFNYRTDNMYGMLGACRLTSYGVECRSLGGAWFNPLHFEVIYMDVERAMNVADKMQDDLLSLPSIPTYISDHRYEFIGKYKKLLNI